MTKEEILDSLTNIIFREKALSSQVYIALKEMAEEIKAMEEGELKNNLLDSHMFLIESIRSLSEEANQLAKLHKQISNKLKKKT